MTKPGSRVCVDTSSVIAFLTGAPGVDILFATHPYCLSITVLGELYYGAYRSRDLAGGLEEIRRLLRRVTVLPQTPETARLYGEIKAELAARGTMIPDNDIWIAAASIENNLPLATRDNHFDRIPTLPVLRW